MDASQYKDYVLTLLFMKYVSDKAQADPDSLIDVPEGGSFDDMVALKGDKEIGDSINKIIGKLAEANGLAGRHRPGRLQRRGEARQGQGDAGPPLQARHASSTTSTSAAPAPKATTCSATPTST